MFRGCYANASSRKRTDGRLHSILRAAYAQDAEMSLHDFEEFVFDVCFLNDANPIARWKEVSAQQQRLVDWLIG